MRAIRDAPTSPDAPPGADTDHDLVRESLHRPEAFAAIFDRHAPAIHGYLSRRVGAVADDLLSETFLTAFRKRGEYRPDRVDVRPWLYGIAANLVLRHRRDEVVRYRGLARSSASRSPAGLGSAEELDLAVDRVDAERMRPLLAAALADLDARDRDVLLLLAWGHLSHAEVASALGIPLGTVRSRLHRARRQLTERLAHLTTTAPHRESR